MGNVANVFVSHRGVDLRLVEKLCTDLRSHSNHTIWLDSEMVRIGDSIIREINRGLREPVRLVLCLSSSGISDFMDREWMSTLKRQLDGEDVKILPIRLSGGELPDIIKDLRYADFHRDWAIALKELLRALNS